MSKLLTSSEVLASIRDLTVQLRRKNRVQAESIAVDVSAYLTGAIKFGADSQSPDQQRAQQTMFAIDEVRTLLAEQDFDGAVAAARDAAKEWKAAPG